MARNASFPPPLTSISGSTNVQFRSHREEGRLVLEAVSVQSCQAYFHAERMDGRLRLHLLKNCYPYSYNEDKEEEEEEAKAAAAAAAAASAEEEESSFEDALVEEDGEENLNWEAEEDEKWEEEMEENDRDEMGIKKMTRLSRCKEGEPGNEGLLCYEQFWVAT